jgi:hypothetical protein
MRQLMRPVLGKMRNSCALALFAAATAVDSDAPAPPEIVNPPPMITAQARKRIVEARALTDLLSISP